MINITHYQQKSLKFIKHLYQHFSRVGGIYRAAALTYVTLLSLVPFLSVSLSIFAVFPIMDTASVQLKDFIVANFIPASGEVIQTHLDTFIEQTSHLSVTGIIFLLITAIALIFTLERTFNDIWRVEKGRHLLSTIILYWGILTIAPILMGIGVGLSSYLFSLPLIQDTTTFLGLTEPILFLTPFGLTLITFTLLYIAIPNRPVPFKHAFWGALIATFLYEIAKKGFVFYVTNFPTYTLIYGALATIPIFFVWVYVSWAIILFGAILSYIFATGYERKLGNKRSAFLQTFYWLGYLWEEQQQGKGLSLKQLLHKDGNVEYSVRPESLLNYLKQHDLIKEYAPLQYMLSRDLNTLSVYDLDHLLPWGLPETEELANSDNPWQQKLYQQIQQVDAAAQANLSIPLVKFYH